ncbi:MAG: squalene synthase HpnC [Bryobacteraceae bacterium]|nr:squalene synthase HpnC [Bryobacteraceae bacterium]
MHLFPRQFVDSVEASNRVYTVAEAESYTRWLATAHYENFHVVSFLLPKALHQDFYNVYSFCRWADDLGDEFGDPARSLKLLAWWREELHAMYAGQTRHPVFVALEGTARKHQLPITPFDDLITAFIQDQTVSRYANWAELEGYCLNSANPVGRLVLMLCGYRDEERFRLSDATCTGLQLANFWQDVTVDWDKDRVYLPLDLLARHGVSVDQIAQRKFNPAFANAMREAVAEARRYFSLGLPLVGTVNRQLALDLDLFNRGGLAILDRIEAEGFDVLKARPRISKVARVRILMGSLARWAFRAA